MNQENKDPGMVFTSVKVKDKKQKTKEVKPIIEKQICQLCLRNKPKQNFVKCLTCELLGHIAITCENCSLKHFMVNTHKSNFVKIYQDHMNNATINNNEEIPYVVTIKFFVMAKNESEAKISIMQDMDTEIDWMFDNTENNQVEYNKRQLELRSLRQWRLKQ